LGPFPDKHTAGRYIELFEDAFDLCRYHHILVQTPNATACAYKEMGMCPAPCDGSISMSQYGTQVQAAIDFGSTPTKDYRKRIEQRRSDAMTSGDHEAAQRWQSLLDRTALATKPSYAHVGRLQDFRMLAVMQSEHRDFVRLFVILGGEITPMLDTSGELDRHSLAELHAFVSAFATQPVDVSSNPARENLALACWHLFRSPKNKHGGSFLKLDARITVPQLKQAIHKVIKHKALPAETVAEQFTEDAGLSGV
jgi:excinuclease UvrABC nuclease subunit